MVSSFINSQFSYWPLIWMFTSKGCIKESIEYMKDRSVILNDYKSSFYDMIFTLNEKTIHQRCINVLSTDV